MNLSPPKVIVEPSPILNLTAPVSVEPEDNIEPVPTSSDSGVRLSACMNLSPPQATVEPDTHLLNLSAPNPTVEPIYKGNV